MREDLDVLHKMFRRINIEEENNLARESFAEFQRLRKESSSLCRLSLVSALVAALLIAMDLFVFRKFEGWGQAGVVAFLISSLLNYSFSRRRLKEIESIGCAR